ncbi:MAG TPA: M15 family metallopeptidase [Oscillospiraceae bacterium]|nr:M15 family metallopeptidase [Oscillospiraceae bacterium]
MQKYKMLKLSLAALLLLGVVELVFLEQEQVTNQTTLQRVKTEMIAVTTVPVPQCDNDYHLLLVNEALPITVGESAFTLVPAYGHLPLKTADTMLEEKTLQQAELMIEAAQAAGMNNLVITSGYRSAAEQAQLYREAADKDYVAKPGTSEHELGLAIDLQILRNGFNSFLSSRQGAWLVEHAHQYGFIMRYPQEKAEITGIPYEPWHFRYVGIPHAAVMAESKLCLEEYLAALNPGTVYQIKTETQNYLVYRVKTRENCIEIPEDLNYQLSCDGTGHYIVTVEIGDIDEGAV